MTAAVYSSRVSIGLGLRRAFAEPLLARLASGDAGVDWLELIPENYLGRGGRTREQLDRACATVPVHAHGVSANLGGPDPLDGGHLDAMGRFLDRIGASEWSEHLCFTAAAGHHFHELLPLPMCEEAVAHVAARVRTASRITGRPLLLENIASYARMPGSTLDEGTFVRRVCEESGARLLLDVNNVFVTATNAGISPAALLESLPLERTGQIHIAGHKHRGELAVDSHDRAVAPQVHALLARALRRTGPVPVMLEWDLRIPALDAVLTEVDAVRATVVAALHAAELAKLPSTGAWQTAEAAGALHAQ